MIACVLVPYFAATVERREDPSLVGLPLVIGGFPGDPGKVYAVSGEAARMGVRPGMPLRQAQALCPEARFITATQTRYQRAFDELLKVLASFTPLVEPGDLQPAAIPLRGLRSYLDLKNLDWATAVEVVQRIGQAVREQAPAIGLARGKFTAHMAAAAVEPNEALLIAPGHETAFPWPVGQDGLAPFPVDFLPLDQETARRLGLLGIRTMGQLAALPAGAVLAQFGKAGQFYQRLAQGRDDRPVLSGRPRETERVIRQPVLSDQTGLNDPVGDRIILESVARSMAGELAARLQARDHMGQKLELTLHLEDGTTRADEILLRQPTSEAEHIAQTLSQLLAQRRVPCGVVELEVTLADLVPARGQPVLSGRTGQLRRALGKKRAGEEIERFRAAFLDGARARGVPEAVAEAVFT